MKKPIPSFWLESRPRKETGLALPAILKSLITIGFAVCLTPSFAENRYTYHAKIQCPNSSSIINEYFYASSDNEVKNTLAMILNKPIYLGQGCKLVDLISDKPDQPLKTFEVHRLNGVSR